jgi:hypothetical protein
MQTEHYVMNEKHRPSTLEGYVCDDIFKQKVEGWIEQQNIPHLFLWGRPGSGKTTLAKILAKNIDCDYIMINATDKRGIDDIRNEILPFVSVMSFKSAPKIVILDECLDEQTLVTVLRGGEVKKIPIKYLDEKNDLVKSYNESTKQIQWMPFELFYKGEQDCYEIEFENGEKVICTESHKWYIDDENSNPIVVTTKEVIEKGYILSI